jgi:predicted homoserine dehydrogenase-like protein
MILDVALLKRKTAGRAVRVGIVGAGATGRATALPENSEFQAVPLR